MRLPSSQTAHECNQAASVSHSMDGELLFRAPHNLVPIMIRAHLAFWRPNYRVDGKGRSFLFSTISRDIKPSTARRRATTYQGYFIRCNEMYVSSKECTTSIPLEHPRFCASEHGRSSLLIDTAVVPLALIAVMSRPVKFSKVTGSRT